MIMLKRRRLAPYQSSLAGTLLAAREAVMAPIRPILRQAGVTDQQWRVLRVLSGTKEMDAQSIAAAAILHSPSVTRIIKEMVERGLVERGVDVSDGRRSIIAITPRGRELVEETATHTLRVLASYEEAFGTERLEALRSELATFVDFIAPFAPQS